jgi:hypothetical protein
VLPLVRRSSRSADDSGGYEDEVVTYLRCTYLAG